MKTLTRFRALSAVCCLLFVACAAAQTVPTGYVLVSGTNTADAGGNVAADATIAFYPVTNAGTPMSLRAAGGYGAKATAQFGVTIASQIPGSGYSGSWSCAINGGTYSSGPATCSATVSSGGLVFAITSAGTYSAPPTSLSFSGGTYAAGSPASAVLSLTLSGANVVSGGTGYVVTTAAFPGCSGAITSAVTVSSGAVSAVSATGGACPNGSAVVIYGSGQAGPTPVLARVINGAFSLLLADSVAATPVNICYNVTLTDNSTGNALFGPGYSCVQPAGSGVVVSGSQPWCVAGGGGAGGACDLDRYTPNLAAQIVSQAWPTTGLSVGTVSTLSSGSPATASITGNAPNQTLNLGLPAGPGGNATFSSMISGDYCKGTGSTTCSGVTPAAVLADIAALPLAGGTVTGPILGVSFSDNNTGAWTFDIWGDSQSNTQAGQCVGGSPYTGGTCWYSQYIASVKGLYGTGQAGDGNTYATQFLAAMGTSGTLNLPWKAHSILLAGNMQNDINRASSAYINLSGTLANNTTVTVNGTAVTLCLAAGGGSGVCTAACSGAGSGTTVCIDPTHNFTTAANWVSVICPTQGFSGSPLVVPGCTAGAGSTDPNLSLFTYGTDQLGVIRLQPNTNGGTATLSTSDSTNIKLQTTPPAPADITNAFARQVRALIALQTGETAAQSNGGIASIIPFQSATPTGTCSSSTFWGTGWGVLCNNTSSYTAHMSGSSFGAIVDCGTALNGAYTVTVTPDGSGASFTPPPFPSGTLSPAITMYGPGYNSLCFDVVDTTGYDGPATVVWNYVSGTVLPVAFVSNGNATGTPDQRYVAVWGGYAAPNNPEWEYSAARAGEREAVQLMAGTEGYPAVYVPVGEGIDCQKVPSPTCGAGGFQHLSLAYAPIMANYFRGLLSTVASPSVNQASRAGVGSTSSLPVGAAVIGSDGSGNPVAAATTGGGSTVMLAGTPTGVTSIDGVPINLCNANSTALGVLAFGSTPCTETGTTDTGVGTSALQGVTSGSNNTAVGASALANVSTTNLNTAVGFQAGRNADGIALNFTGSNCTFLGAQTSAFSASDSGCVVIGQGAVAEGQVNAVTLGALNQAAAYINGLSSGVYIDGPLIPYGSIATTAVATPTSPDTNTPYSAATTGGTLSSSACPGSLCYYRVSCNTVSGTTLASAEHSVAISGSTATATITWNPDPGCKSYDVYGRTTGTELLMTPAHVAANARTFTDDGSITPSGALPAANTTAGTVDFSLAPWIKMPIAAGAATTASGQIVHDSTNHNWHIWANGADNFMALFPSASPPTTGDCVKWTLTSSVWTLGDAGAACGAGGGGGTVTVVGAGSLTSTAIVTGGGTTTLQTPSATATLNSSGNMSLPGTLAVTGHVTVEGVTSSGATGTGNFVFAASPAFTGTPDASGATQFKLPVGAAFATAANGEHGYDTTNLNWHVWQNAVDNFEAVFPVASPPTSGHVTGFLKSTNSWSLQDLGAFTLTGMGATFSAPLSLSGNTVTGPTIVTSAASLTSAAIMTGGGSQASQTPSATATLNSSGNMSLPGTLAVTGHVTLEGVTSAGASGTGNLVFSGGPTFTGTVTLATLAATTINGAAFSGSFTGAPTFSGNIAFTGTPTFSNALALGSSTATTQAAKDNSTKLATTAYVDAPTGLTTGTSITLTAPRQYFICTSTCTITVPVPAAGDEFCVINDDNVSTVITLSAIGSSARYENTARTAYGTAGTGTFVSGGAAGDKVCLLGRDSTHYLTASFNGTWTAN